MWASKSQEEEGEKKTKAKSKMRKKMKHGQHEGSQMVKFARIDLQIRAHRPASRESLQGSRTEPLFLRIALRGAKNCESQGLRRFARIARTL